MECLDPCLCTSYIVGNNIMSFYFVWFFLTHDSPDPSASLLHLHCCMYFLNLYRDHKKGFILNVGVDFHGFPQSLWKLSCRISWMTGSSQCFAKACFIAVQWKDFVSQFPNDCHVWQLTSDGLFLLFGLSRRVIALNRDNHCVALRLYFLQWQKAQLSAREAQNCGGSMSKERWALESNVGELIGQRTVKNTILIVVLLCCLFIILRNLQEMTFPGQELSVVKIQWSRKVQGEGKKITW